MGMSLTSHIRVEREMRENQNIVVGLVTRLWAGLPGNCGSIPAGERDFFLISNSSRPGPTLMCSRGSFLRSKAARTSADHTPSSDARVRYELTCTFTPPVCFSWCVQGKLYLTYVEGVRVQGAEENIWTKECLRKLHNEIMICILIQNTGWTNEM